MAGKPCHYEVLGLARSASSGEVKKAYRKKALYWHPDKNPNNRDQATEMFRLVSEAYEVLGDSEKRRYYDTYGHEGVASAEQQQSAGGAGAYEDHWHNQHNPFPHGMRDPFEMFESFFGRAGAGNGGGVGGGMFGMMGAGGFFDQDPFFAAAGGGAGGSGGRSGSGSRRGGAGGGGGGGFGSLFPGHGFMMGDDDFFGGGGGFGGSGGFSMSSMSSSSSNMGGGVSTSTSTSTTIGSDGVRRTKSRTEKTVVHPDGTRETKVEEFVDGVPVPVSGSIANG